MKENRDMAELLDHLAAMPGAFREADRGELREWAQMLREFPQAGGREFRHFVEKSLEREGDSVAGLVRRMRQQMAGGEDDRLAWSLGRARSRDLKAVLVELGERAGRTVAERRARLMELAGLGKGQVVRAGGGDGGAGLEGERIEELAGAYQMLREGLGMCGMAELRQRVEGLLGGVDEVILKGVAERLGLDGGGGVSELKRRMVRALEDEKVRLARRGVIRGQW